MQIKILAFEDNHEMKLLENMLINKVGCRYAEHESRYMFHFIYRFNNPSVTNVHII